MNFISKLERKFGRFAIHDLPAIIIGLYAAGYILKLTAPDILSYLTLDPGYILRGQIWRIVTWVIVPPGSFDVFTIIMLFFYFSIGRILERTWGAFRFNLYFFSGMLFSVAASFILYVWYTASGYQVMPGAFGTLFSTYYINMSIFLAFAVTYPDMEVLLYFIIPVKMKWMGILYGVLIIYDMTRYTMAGRVMIIASLLNFLIYWLLTRRESGHFDARQFRRQQEFRKKTVQPDANNAKPMHRCAVCGRTEKDDPSLEFRYCSKCDGAYEYCQDHLFTHTHIRKQ